MIEDISHLIENVCGRVEQFILVKLNFDMEASLRNEKYVMWTKFEKLYLIEIHCG